MNNTIVRATAGLTAQLQALANTIGVSAENIQRTYKSSVDLSALTAPVLYVALSGSELESPEEQVYAGAFKKVNVALLYAQRLDDFDLATLDAALGNVEQVQNALYELTAWTDDDGYLYQITDIDINEAPEDAELDHNLFIGKIDVEIRTFALL